MNARLLYLTLVSEMSIKPNGLPAKLKGAAPLLALPVFFMSQTGTLRSTLRLPFHSSERCRPHRLLNIFLLGRSNKNKPESKANFLP